MMEAPRMEGRGMLATGVSGLAGQYAEPAQGEAQIGSGLSRLEHAANKLHDEIEKLEARLGAVLSPVNDPPQGEKLASIAEKRSPMADELHGNANALDEAAFRLEQLRHRIEL